MGGLADGRLADVDGCIVLYRGGRGGDMISINTAYPPRFTPRGQRHPTRPSPPSQSV